MRLTLPLAHHSNSVSYDTAMNDIFTSLPHLTGGGCERPCVDQDTKVEHPTLWSINTFLAEPDALHRTCRRISTDSIPLALSSSPYLFAHHTSCLSLSYSALFQACGCMDFACTGDTPPGEEHNRCNVYDSMLRNLLNSVYFTHSSLTLVIDFEYSDRQYTRNFAGVDGAGKLSNNISFRLNYFREGDDPDAPIDISLSDADKLILQQAGNATATRTGIILAGVDSLGIGDTVGTIQD